METVDLGGLRLAYDVVGKGEAIVLVMGIGGQAVFWPMDFCLGLAERGFKVIRFDNRDVGESHRYSELGPAPLKQILIKKLLGFDPDPPYTLRDMAGDVVALVDHLKIDQFHVLGMSMGGMIAQRVAIHFPGRVKTLCSMMSTDGRIWLGKPRAMRVLFRPNATSRAAAIKQGIETFRTIGSTGFVQDEALLTELISLSYDRGRDPVAVGRQLGAIIAEPSRVALLKLLKMPSLVIHGTVDPLVPCAAGRATAKAIQGARYLEIPGMGHDLPPGVWKTVQDAVAQLAFPTNGNRK